MPLSFEGPRDPRITEFCSVESHWNMHDKQSGLRKPPIHDSACYRWSCTAPDHDALHDGVFHTWLDGGKRVAKHCQAWLDASRTIREIAIAKKKQAARYEE